MYECPTTHPKSDAANQVCNVQRTFLVSNVYRSIYFYASTKIQRSYLLRLNAVYVPHTPIKDNGMSTTWSYDSLKLFKCIETK